MDDYLATCQRLEPAEYERALVEGKGDLDFVRQHMQTFFESKNEAALRDQPTWQVQQGQQNSAPLGMRMAAEMCRGRYLYVEAIGWHQWDGMRWKRMSTEALDLRKDAEAWVVDRLTRMPLEMASSEAAVLTKALSKMASYRETSKIEQLVAGAAYSPLIRCSADRLDAQRHLLNCLNGTVDLRTGELKAHDPDDFITTLAPTTYTPGFSHDDWTQALAGVKDGTHDYLQIQLGQGIWGEKSPKDEIAIHYGGGSNGKNTVLGTVTMALGDYACSLPHRLLLGNPQDHPTEWMTLRGVRVGWVDELPEARHLDSSVLKRLTDDKITARYTRQDNVTFENQATIMISTNYMIMMSEVDYGTWRRPIVFEYPYAFINESRALAPSERPGDQTLRPRLQARPDTPGQRAALAWMVAGAVRYHEASHTLPPLPVEMKESTDLMRLNSDVLMRFVSDHLEFDDQALVLSAELFDTFTEWMRAQQGKAWSQQLFTQRMTQHPDMKRNKVSLFRTAKLSTLSRSNPARSTSLVKQPQVWGGLRWKPAPAVLAMLGEDDDEE